MEQYAKALRDWRYLWETYAQADDMTGGYVDQDDLKKLLFEPTKKMAARCLSNQIAFWFQNGPDKFEMNMSGKKFPMSDPRVIEICRDYVEPTKHLHYEEISKKAFPELWECAKP